MGKKRKAADAEIQAATQKYVDTLFRVNVERVAAKQILTDIVNQGLTPELRDRAYVFLVNHPDD